MTTQPEVNPSTSHQTPGSDNATGSQLLTAPQSLGSDLTTGSDSPDSGSDNATGSELVTAPQSPEVTSQPEVTARPGVKKCALLHKAVNGLYICVGCGMLRLVVLLWGDLNQRMRVE